MAAGSGRRGRRGRAPTRREIVARAVVEAAPDCVIVADERGTVRELNRAAERAFGHRRGAAVGRHLGDLVSWPPLRDALAAGLARLLTADEDRTVGRRVEAEGLRADGSAFPIELTIERIPAGGGRLLVAYARDITERRRTERALRESEARFHAAADSLADGLAIFDAEDRLAYYNGRFADHLMPGVRGALAPGRRLEEMVREGMRGAPVYHPDMGPDFLERRLALREQPASDHEQHLADGRWLRVRESRMPDGGRVMLMSDVTARKLAEQRLGLMAAAVEQVGDAVEIAGAGDHRLAYVNPAFARLTGYAAEEALGRTPAELLRGDRRDDDAFLAAIDAALRSGRTWQGRLVGRRKDGGPIVQDATISPLRDEAGRVTHLVAVRRDVGGREQAAAALRESEARFRAIADGVPVAIVITAPDAPEVLFANRRATEVLGLTVGPRAERLAAVWGDDLGARLRFLRRVAEEGAVEGFEATLRRADGGPMEALISARAVEHDGRPAVLAAVADVTGQRRAEAALRESEARLAAFVEHAPLVLHLKDRDGRYLLANPEAAKIFGRDPAGVIGRAPAEVFPPEEAAMIDRHHREVLETGRAVAHEEHQPSLGAYEWSIVIRFPVRDAHGRVAVVGGFALDITERKRAEETLAASEDRLRRVLDNLFAFVGVLSPGGVLLDANRVPLEAAGLRREDELGRPFWDSRFWSWSAAVQGRVRDAVARAARGETVRYDEEARLEEGVLITLDLQIAPLRDAKGRVTDLIASGVDVTARKRAEARLAAFMQHAPVGMYLKDGRGRYLVANPEMAKVFGRPVEEVLGRTVEGLFAPEEAEAIRARDREILEGGVATVHEEHLPDLDAYEWSMVIRFPVRDGSGAVTHVGGFDVDITPQKRAGRALRESEARLRAIVEDQTELICRFDRDFRLTFSNAANARLFGRSPDELVGLDFFEPIPEPTRSWLRAGLEALTPENPVHHGENESVLPGGEVRWFEWLNRALFDAGGRLAGYQSVGRDITERRRAEEELRRSEARFRSIVEDQTEFISRFTPDLAITFVNRAYAAQLGRRREDLVGGSLLDLMTEAQRARFTAQLAALTPEAPTVSYEMDTVLPDGSLGWERWTDRALFGGARRLVEYQSVGRDVTARKRAERALRESEARFRAIVEDQTELISRYDRDFRCTFSNAADARLLGKTPEEMIGSDFFRSIPEPARSRLRAELLALTPENPVYRGENEKVLPNGEVRWFEWADRALFDAEGRLAGYQSVGRDITERRRAEEEIARQREALHQQEKLGALGSLLAGVAHELNNPLAVVVGRAIMLEEEAGDPGTAASLARLRAAAERCAKIVKTFLAMARQRPRERRLVAVDAVLEAALEMVAYGLRSAGVEVARDLAADLPRVLADEDQLHQVFLNLLVNAQQALRDAPPPRRVLVGAHREGAFVRVEVADTGPGVPPAIRRRIFEPFFTTKPTGAGTGIGLSVCHAIVAAHGGAIEAGERPGGGALFTVRLPAAAGAEEAGAAAPEAAAPGPVAPARILVVDDEPEVLAMLEEILARDGHAVELAAGGRDALRRLEEGRGFDLVISDLRMPDVDGRELHRALLSRHPGLAARMILLTGDTLGTPLADLPGLDRDALLEKPVEPAVVRRVVRRRLAAGPPGPGGEP